ncbi:MAG: hypothetical protein PHF84_02745 [bacterium]|nr:hypothetical protein [bacterium]
MEQKTGKLSIILPCAGEGKRLGLTAPKELFEIMPGIRLIDFSLKHIRHYLMSEPASPQETQILVVIKKGKEKVFHYVKKQFSDIPVSAVYFNNKYHEWPGSVHSSSPLQTRYNLAFLPDSVICLSGPTPVINRDNQGLIGIFMKKIRSHPVVLGTIRCTDPETLKHLGACYVKEHKVLRFQDKPEGSFMKYNCFWGCYGFQKQAGHELYSFLWNSVRHRKPSYRKTSFYPMASFPIEAYHDLGTWESITELKASLQMIRFFSDN